MKLNSVPKALRKKTLSLNLRLNFMMSFREFQREIEKKLNP